MKYLTDDGKVFDTITEASNHEESLKNPKRTLVFKGHSDDIVYLESYPSGNDCDEYYREQIFVVKDTKGEGLIVKPVYNGTWGFAICLLEEDKPLPPWNIEVHCRGYSADLYIDVPSNVYVSAQHDISFT